MYTLRVGWVVRVVWVAREYINPYLPPTTLTTLTLPTPPTLVYSINHTHSLPDTINIITNYYYYCPINNFFE